MTAHTYSPAEVSVLVAGVYEISGFSSESIITISKDTSTFSSSTGAYGDVERTKNTNNLHSLTLHLSQTSPSNSVLNSLASIDSISARGLFPLFMQDSSGETFFMASSCWVETIPDASFTGDIESREWVIKASDVLYKFSGNAEERGLLSNASNIASIASQVTEILGRV